MIHELYSLFSYKVFYLYVVTGCLYILQQPLLWIEKTYTIICSLRLLASVMILRIASSSAESLSKHSLSTL